MEKTKAILEEKINKLNAYDEQNSAAIKSITDLSKLVNYDKNASDQKEIIKKYENIFNLVQQHKTESDIMKFIKNQLSDNVQNSRMLDKAIQNIEYKIENKPSDPAQGSEEEDQEGLVTYGDNDFFKRDSSTNGVKFQPDILSIKDLKNAELEEEEEDAAKMIQKT